LLPAALGPFLSLHPQIDIDLLLAFSLFLPGSCPNNRNRRI
jgi:hypothetical protein